MIMKKLLFYFLAAAALVSCGGHGPETPPEMEHTHGVYILNEGSWGADNASLTLLDLESGQTVEDLYSTVNGEKLGDVANDILFTDDYMIIAVNGSNIIQFCTLDGKSAGQTEDVPGCRKLAADPEGRYLYVTSYASEGEVVKIDLKDFSTVGRVKVGYEPEGIVWYKGRLYVANTGGNAYLGTHGYEETISVIDAASMKESARIETGHHNLYGDFIQNDKYPRYIMVNASGDYYMEPAASFIFDCDTDSVIAEYSDPSTYAATHDGKFYTIGSAYDAVTYEYKYSFRTIDLNSGSPVVSDGIVAPAVTEAISHMQAPYGLFFDSEGRIYATDAADYMNRGLVYKFTQTGEPDGKYVTGVCPGHFAAR